MTPNGLTNILHFYGANTFAQDGTVINPKNWRASSIVSVPLPAPMIVTGTHTAVKAVALHISLRGSFERVIQNLFDNYPEAYHQLTFSGSFVPRMKRGLSEPSLHGLGCAVDFNSGQFPLNRSRHRTPAEMPLWYQNVIHCFHLEGWKWGGDFGDEMHFQYATGY